MLKKLLLLLALSLLSVSCGEEVLTQSTLSNSEKYADVETYNLNSCANMRFVKPPVDILFVVDNSGSTLQSSFAQIKSQIAATATTISSEFDYHIYIAPLMKQNDEDITKFPLVVHSKDGVDPNASFIRLQDINSTTFFAPATGGGAETGFQRVHNLIDANRANGIFREEANTIAVLISNGDDTEVMTAIGNNVVFDPGKFESKKSKFQELASTKLKSDSFRFISLVPHPIAMVGEHMDTIEKCLKKFTTLHGLVFQRKAKTQAKTQETFAQAITQSFFLSSIIASANKSKAINMTGGKLATPAAKRPLRKTILPSQKSKKADRRKCFQEAPPMATPMRGIKRIRTPAMLLIQVSPQQDL